MGRRFSIPLSFGICAGFACGMPAGCTSHRSVEPAAPPRSAEIEAVRRLAVTPVLNFTGQPQFDPVRAADLLASELMGMGGFTVIPVNRVLAALDRLGTPYVKSPQTALELCHMVGADGVLVGAVTEYDPYAPMVVGLTLELFVASDAPDRSIAGSPGLWSPARLALQMQERYNGSDEGVVARVKAFAARRSEDAGPFAWRRYLVAQERFLRFCFAEGLGTLFAGQQAWAGGPDQRLQPKGLGKTSDE